MFDGMDECLRECDTTTDRLTADALSPKIRSRPASRPRQPRYHFFLEYHGRDSYTLSCCDVYLPTELRQLSLCFASRVCVCVFLRHRSSMEQQPELDVFVVQLVGIGGLHQIPLNTGAIIVDRWTDPLEFPKLVKSALHLPSNAILTFHKVSKSEGGELVWDTAPVIAVRSIVMSIQHYLDSDRKLLPFSGAPVGVNAEFKGQRGKQPKEPWHVTCERLITVWHARCACRHVSHGGLPANQPDMYCTVQELAPRRPAGVVRGVCPKGDHSRT